jgi:hypothetical protein
MSDLRDEIQWDHCGGIVTRDGEQDACGKPTTCIVRDDEGRPWAACVWHAHRYGTGHMVTLAEIREELA